MTSSEDQRRFMHRAIELSREKMQAGEGGPFGALIVKDGKIVAEGWNQVTSANDPTAHAEIVAIRRAAQSLKTFDLTGAELYSTCEPCPMCLAAAYWAHISKIYFGSTCRDASRHDFLDEFLYLEIPKPHADRVLPLEQLERDEANKVFKEWDLKANKIRY